MHVSINISAELLKGAAAGAATLVVPIYLLGSLMGGMTFGSTSRREMLSFLIGPAVVGGAIGAVTVSVLAGYPWWSAIPATALTVATVGGIYYIVVARPQRARRKNRLR